MTRFAVPLLDRLVRTLTEIRDQCLSMERSYAREIERIDPEYRISARNLLHYLALRQHDLGDIQRDLSSCGLSSLGRMEAHTLAGLDAVLAALHKLAGLHTTRSPEPVPQVDFATGPAILSSHTEQLLGRAPHGRAVRIMVTMPSEAAANYGLVRDLLTAGMDVMRINCAHDDSPAWQGMIENLSRAKQETGRRCRVLMDLAGPKLRTGQIRELSHLVRWKPRRDVRGHVMAPALVWVTGDQNRAKPPLGKASAILPLEDQVIARLQNGMVLRFRDCRNKLRRLKVVSKGMGGVWAESEQGAYVEQGTRIELVVRGRKRGESQVGKLPAVEDAIGLHGGDTLILTGENEPGAAALRTTQGRLQRSAHIGCTLPEVFRDARAGQRIFFDDGKIEGVIRRMGPTRLRVEITRTGDGGAKLRSDKGINLPDTKLALPAFTEKDLADLQFAARHADMVGFSFLRNPEHVRRLIRQLQKHGAAHLGVLLKIENRAAFEHLPRMLLAGLESPPLGVVVARGDLAVEMGFERLAEVQEEILWLSEAAHVPVVWATQVLETLAHTGRPSRAEVTDAAMSGRAECVMLNKGPHIVEAVRFLDDVLRRMQRHQKKKRAMLRRLAISELAEPAQQATRVLGAAGGA
ncbi:MAG: pyruvate kinase [Acidobacteriia bacterium]|nr:pyruvate kinase [Terriglobia bacterium]